MRSSYTPPPGIKDPYGPGLTLGEASPDLIRIVAKNQQWAENNGYARKGDPSHGALRAVKGQLGDEDGDGEDSRDPKSKRGR